MLESANPLSRKTSIEILLEIYKTKVGKGQEVDESLIKKILRCGDTDLTKEGVKSLVELYKMKMERGHEIDEIFIYEMLKVSICLSGKQE